MLEDSPAVRRALSSSRFCCFAARESISLNFHRTLNAPLRTGIFVME